MTDPLSPAAQVVDDAAYAAWVTQDCPRSIAAAVLRVIADQAGSEKRLHVDDIIAIVTELETQS